MARISLLLLMAASASIATVGNAFALATGATDQAPPTRLGVAIDSDLQKRDKAVNRRGRALDLREQAVRAAEARLGKSGPSPADTAAAAAAPTATAPGAPGAPPAADQFDDLARIYQAMKPAAAALVLEQLDLDVQMRVAQKMRERSTAMIMAAMTPKAAATLTMALARRRAGPPVVASAVAKRQ